MTAALLVLLIVPVVLGTVLARRAHRAPLVSPRERAAMYRTAYGFGPAREGVGTTPDTTRHHTPTVFLAAFVPSAASGMLAVFAAPHQVKQLWTFSCRLFGH